MTWKWYHFYIWSTSHRSSHKYYSFYNSCWSLSLLLLLVPKFRHAIMKNWSNIHSKHFALIKQLLKFVTGRLSHKKFLIYPTNLPNYEIMTLWMWLSIFNFKFLKSEIWPGAEVVLCLEDIKYLNFGSANTVQSFILRWELKDETRRHAGEAGEAGEADFEDLLVK